MVVTPSKSCRTCWFSETRRAAADRGEGVRWTCILGRRPGRPPFVCTGHAPDQGRAPTPLEINTAKEFA